MQFGFDGHLGAQISINARHQFLDSDAVGRPRVGYPGQKSVKMRGVAREQRFVAQIREMDQNANAIREWLTAWIFVVFQQSLSWSQLARLLNYRNAQAPASAIANDGLNVSGPVVGEDDDFLNTRDGNMSEPILYQALPKQRYGSERRRF